MRVSRALRAFGTGHLIWNAAVRAKAATSFLPVRDDRLEIGELFAEELWLALPRGHRLTRRRTVRSSDLNGERLVVMKEGHCLGDQVLIFCERRDVSPSISFRSAQLETIRAPLSVLSDSNVKEHGSVSGFATDRSSASSPQARSDGPYLTHGFKRARLNFQTCL